MDTVNQIFGFYDKTIFNMPIHYQALLSLAILIFFIWMVYIFLKSKNWIFLAIIIVLLPETWPAARNIGMIAWNIFKGLFLRLKGL